MADTASVWDALAVAALSLAGCSPRPVAVWIDLDAVPLPALARAENAPSQPGHEPVLPYPRIQETKARTLYLGSGQGLAKEALQEARANQDKALKQATERLRDAYRAASLATSTSAEAKVRLEFDKKWASLFADLRQSFDSHAKAVGPLWIRLSTLAGFPDDGKVRVMEPGFLQEDPSAEISRLREQIKDLDGEYRRLVASKIESLKQEFRAAQTELLAEKIKGLDEADERARLTAETMVSTIIDDLHTSLIKDMAKLPALKPVSIQVEPVKLKPLRQPEDEGAPWTTKQRLADQAQLFAQSRGYVLSTKRNSDIDKTKEFLEWQRHVTGR